MRIRTLSIISLAIAAMFGLTACNTTPAPSAAPATVTQTVTVQPPTPVLAPTCATKVPVTNQAPAANAERKVETLLPSDACDYTVQVGSNGKVSCNPNVGTLEIPVANGEVNGFLGKLKVLTSDGLTRIDWVGDKLGVHTLIVNDTKWGYVDGIADKQTRPAGRVPLATNLRTDDWGKITKLTACGWGM